MSFEPTLDYARKQDTTDELASYRDRFHMPVQANGDPFLYFTGNSLGCQPKSTRAFVEQELADWEKLGVEGHFHARNPWMPYHEFLTQGMCQIVGGNSDEVVVMNSLTVNLHLLMASFYRPDSQRYKIMIEADAFPSDIYAVKSQLEWHGHDVESGLIMLKPRAGEHCLRTEDIVAQIEKENDSLALVLLGGVNYYTGQFFEIETITQAVHGVGAIMGVDLAHAVGNVPLHLHKWGVDFACWCTYKYLNSGPGGVGGAFIHRRHVMRKDLPRLAGWWGHDAETRFQMGADFVPMASAEGWQLSNAPILSMAALRASLELFDEVGMEKLRSKALRLTGYLEYLLKTRLPEGAITLITPEDPTQRGCQLSLLTGADGKKWFDTLTEAGVICDWREPNVIRTAPAPFYNTFEDVWRFVDILTSVVA